MALTVETGLGLPGAESYCSAEAFVAYHAARGREREVDRYDEEVIEPHLRLATDFLGYAYGSRWAGTRATHVQSLDWPRRGVLAPSVGNGAPAYLSHAAIPAAIVGACAELALRSLRGEALMPDAPAEPEKTRVTVGPITTEYGSRPRPSAARFAAVDASLRHLMRQGPGVLLERA